jgi:uncharacterized membrane protein
VDGILFMLGIIGMMFMAAIVAVVGAVFYYGVKKVIRKIKEYFKDPDDRRW